MSERLHGVITLVTGFDRVHCSEPTGRAKFIFDCVLSFWSLDAVSSSLHMILFCLSEKTAGIRIIICVVAWTDATPGLVR